MNPFNIRIVRKYLIPGFVFQSVVIAGGYGTGRELVEYFLNYGPLGGVLGMFLFTTLIWAFLLANLEHSAPPPSPDQVTDEAIIEGEFWEE